MMSPDLAPSVRRAVALAAVAASIAAIGAQERRPAAKASQQWEDYGGGPDSSKFVDLRQITPKNVAGLKVAWT